MGGMIMTKQWASSQDNCAVLTCLRTWLQILAESTREAMRLGLTEKFLAEGQPEVGKNGHVLAAVSHRRALRSLP